MNYEVRISESASKEIQLLPKSNIPKIISTIEQLTINPRPSGCKKLIGTPEKLWRIGSGNYQIIFFITNQ